MLVYHRSSINKCLLTSIPLVLGPGRREGWGQSGTVELRFLSGAVLGGETVEEIAGNEAGWELGCWGARKITHMASGIPRMRQERGWEG